MIVKFRTMKTEVETGAHERYLKQLRLDLTAAIDPRLIPGGSFLRATGLDKVPQLLNILSGEMSLVGPRPCTPHEFARYKVWQQERVNAPPGVTGYWQVNGQSKTTFTEMLNMDIFYTKNMSIWLDLEIMLRTLPIMVRTLPIIVSQLIEDRTSRLYSLGNDLSVLSIRRFGFRRHLYSFLKCLG